jgi:hypothetical protein
MAGALTVIPRVFDVKPNVRKCPEATIVRQSAMPVSISQDVFVPLPMSSTRFHFAEQRDALKLCSV